MKSISEIRELNRPKERKRKNYGESRAFSLQSTHLDESFVGTLWEAFQQATQMAIVESGWPKRSSFGKLVPIYVIGDENERFTLTIQFPKSTKGEKGSNE